MTKHEALLGLFYATDITWFCVNVWLTVGRLILGSDAQRWFRSVVIVSDVFWVAVNIVLFVAWYASLPA